MLPPDDCKDCLKGVPNDGYVFGDSVNWDLFNPEALDEPQGWEGSSVNWELDQGALDELLTRRRNGALQFKSGAVRIPRDRLDAIKRRYGVNVLGYELRAENGNRYHGHILFVENLDKRKKATLCGALSNAVSQFHKRGNTGR